MEMDAENTALSSLSTLKQQNGPTTDNELLETNKQPLKSRESVNPKIKNESNSKDRNT